MKTLRDILKGFKEGVLPLDEDDQPLTLDNGLCCLVECCSGSGWESARGYPSKLRDTFKAMIDEGFIENLGFPVEPPYHLLKENYLGAMSKLVWTINSFDLVEKGPDTCLITKIIVDNLQEGVTLEQYIEAYRANRLKLLDQLIDYLEE